MTTPSAAPPEAVAPPSQEAAPVPAVITWFRRVDAIWHTVELTLITVMFLGMILVVALDFLGRDLFKVGVPWAMRFATTIMLWVGLLGAAIATRERRHLTIDASIKLLPPQVVRWLMVIGAAVSAACCAGLTWLAWKFVAEVRDYGDVGTLGAPLWILQLVIPFSALIMTCRFAAQSVENIVSPLPVLPPPPEVGGMTGPLTPRGSRPLSEDATARRP